MTFIEAFLFIPHSWRVMATTRRWPDSILISCRLGIFVAYDAFRITATHGSGCCIALELFRLGKDLTIHVVESTGPSFELPVHDFRRFISGTFYFLSRFEFELPCIMGYRCMEFRSTPIINSHRLEHNTKRTENTLRTINNGDLAWFERCK